MYLAIGGAVYTYLYSCIMFMIKMHTLFDNIFMTYKLFLFVICVGIRQNK